MITVICPTYNEERYINNLLEFFTKAGPADKELYIVDGGSTDQTIYQINNWQKKHKNIHLIINEEKYVPFALNKGIQASMGSPIIRLDAHTLYSADYFEKILQTFDDSSADIVGGPMNPIGENAFQTAVAYATTTKFGIGNSKMHDLKYRGYSDHVYLGAWKRELFDQIGYFDERLKRDQDDEFNSRAKSLGKKIYLNPDIKSFYHPRSNPKSLFKQYFQYGMYKPLVWKKIKSEIKVIHIIPGSFVIYICLIPFMTYHPIILVPVVIYLILNVWFSFKNHYNYKIKMLAFFIYPLLHIAYGTGTICGVKKLFEYSQKYK